MYLLSKNGLNSVPLDIWIYLIDWHVLVFAWDSCRSSENTRVVGALSVDFCYALFLDRRNSVTDAIDYRHRNIVLFVVLHVLIRNKV